MRRKQEKFRPIRHQHNWFIEKTYGILSIPFYVKVDTAGRLRVAPHKWKHHRIFQEYHGL